MVDNVVVVPTVSIICDNAPSVLDVSLSTIGSINAYHLASLSINAAVKLGVSASLVVVTVTGPAPTIVCITELFPLLVGVITNGSTTPCNRSR